MTNPLVLDFDASVGRLQGESRLPLGDWQEELRFGCSLASLERLAGEIAGHLVGHLASRPRPVFLGSGDYHHLSYPLIQRLQWVGRPVQVVVFDNHPDNMRYPFGIHCGSWVRHVARLPWVACVHVLGITSTDVEAAHAWENHLRVLHSGRVRYWCIDRDLGWMRRLGIRHSRSFDSAGAMLEAFSAELAGRPEPVYLSIDKDVLSVADVRTNWDQGVLRLEALLAAIGILKSRLVGADVVGEVSLYRYQSRFKRWLSQLDDQPEPPPEALAGWQAAHHAVNLKLLEALRSE
jgi:arginase family enzyme